MCLSRFNCQCCLQDKIDVFRSGLEVSQPGLHICFIYIYLSSGSVDSADIVGVIVHLPIRSGMLSAPKPQSSIPSSGS